VGHTITQSLASRGHAVIKWEVIPPGRFADVHGVTEAIVQEQTWVAVVSAYYAISTLACIVLTFCSIQSMEALLRTCKALYATQRRITTGPLLSQRTAQRPATKTLSE
jgi:hypothetical protein